MSDQDNQNLLILAAYGEAVFLGYLLESRLQLHLNECMYYNVNGNYAPKSKVRDFKELIDLLKTFYPRKQMPVIDRVSHDLHALRMIRSRLTQGFIHQLQADLERTWDKEQILALLRQVVVHENRYLAFLQQQHAHLLNHVKKKSLEEFWKPEDKPDARGKVTTGEIEALLAELDAKADSFH